MPRTRNGWGNEIWVVKSIRINAYLNTFYRHSQALLHCLPQWYPTLLPKFVLPAVDLRLFLLRLLLVLPTRDLLRLPPHFLVVFLVDFLLLRPPYFPCFFTFFISLNIPPNMPIIYILNIISYNLSFMSLQW